MWSTIFVILSLMLTVATALNFLVVLPWAARRVFQAETGRLRSELAIAVNQRRLPKTRPTAILLALVTWANQHAADLPIIFWRTPRKPDRDQLRISELESFNEAELEEFFELATAFMRAFDRHLWFRGPIGWSVLALRRLHLRRIHKATRSQLTREAAKEEITSQLIELDRSLQPA